MIAGRRWSVAEFESLLVRHPLMINLVRRLLWGVYDADRKLRARLPRSPTSAITPTFTTIPAAWKAPMP